MPRVPRQNLKSLGPKKKNDLKQKTHLKESNYLRNRMRQGITFLPGFVNTGYQTKTVVKNPTQSKNSENLFSESFQELIGQKGNLRRSQRILTKQSINHGDHNRKARRQQRSKSIFKNIDRQYSKRQKEHHSPAHSCDKSDESSVIMFDDEDAPNSPEPLSNDDAELEGACYNECHRQSRRTLIKNNENFCRKFVQAIQVSFKQNAVEQARKRIGNEISTANGVLAGNVVKNDSNVSVDSVEDDRERDEENSIPVPSRKWVYRTPRNKKIATFKIEGSNLQPAIMFKEVGKNRKQKVKFCTKFNDDAESHVENEYFRQLVKTKRTPSRNTEAPFQNCRQFVNMYEEEHSSRPVHECQHHARPYYDNRQCNENIFERAKKMDSCINEHDITVVMDGDNFEMRTSQRRSTDLFQNDSYEYNVNPNHGNIFNFNSQATMFD